MSQYHVVWCPCSFKVEDEELIKTDSKCKDFLIEALKYHLRKGNDSQMVSTPRTRMRTPIGLPKVNTILYRCCIIKPSFRIGYYFIPVTAHKPFVKASKTETLALCQRKPFLAMRQGGILF